MSKRINWPVIGPITFQLCCLDSMKRIQTNLEVVEIINKGAIPLVFISLFFSPTNPKGAGGGMTTIGGIALTDWVGLYNGILGVNQYAKKLCAQIAETERLAHSIQSSTPNNRNLIKFWDTVYYAFNK